MLFTTVEAIYSHRMLKYCRARDISTMRYRAGEWAVLILVLKLLTLADKPLALVWADLQTMWLEPLSAVNFEFYMMLLLATISWMVATSTITDFEDLHDFYAFAASIISPQQKLTDRFLTGGIILVLVSGITQVIVRLGLGSLLDFWRPSLGGILINVLIYFMLGLVLLSQAYLTRLMMSWQMHKVEIGPGLVRQWAKYGLIFLGLVTLLAFLLPTSYTLGFLTSAGLIIQKIIGIFTVFFQLLLLLLSLPLAWLMSLFNTPPRPTPAIPTPAPAPPEIAAAGAALPWLEVLRSLIFWLIALAIFGYLLKIYLSDRPELLSAFKSFKPVALLLNFLKQIWQYLRGIAHAGLEVITERIKLSGQAGGDVTGLVKGWGWLGWNRLPARERILYYYLNILKRAEKRKLSRRSYQTPYEYEPTLDRVMPDVEAEVRELTHIFVRARYSLEGFSDEQVALVKQQWQRIRQALGRANSKTK